jgi:hypothetical protein
MHRPFALGVIMRIIVRTVLAAMVLVFMAACGTTPTEAVIEATLLEPFATSTASPTSDATATPTLKPTITETPSETPTIVPISELTTREPSVEELDAYLRYYYPEELKDFSIGPPLFKDWLYEDVSGDGEPDIVVLFPTYLAVVVWAGDGYGVPYQIRDRAGFYEWGYTSYLQDWTGDKVPEIILESAGSIGGTGYQTGGWNRRIIHCRADSCTEVWYGSIDGLLMDSNSGAMGLNNIRVEMIVASDGSVLMKQYQEDIYLFCCPESEGGTYFDGLAFATGERIYRWTGSTFELISEETLTHGSTVAPPITPATNSFGTQASITATDNGWAGDFNYNCQLHINGEDVGQPFGCRNFVTLSWQDITGDGDVELVIIALSAFAGVQEGEKGCYHQRLIAYQWDAQNGMGAQIANIIGCVVRSDLFGVRLEDLDSDGVQEIIAAGEWFTPEVDGWFEFNDKDDIYRWNGSEYVYSKTVLRD